jgi:hypothetical protein
MNLEFKELVTAYKIKQHYNPEECSWPLLKEHKISESYVPILGTLKRMWCIDSNLQEFL